MRLKQCVLATYTISTNLNISYYHKLLTTPNFMELGKKLALVINHVHVSNITINMLEIAAQQLKMRT